MNVYDFWPSVFWLHPLLQACCSKLVLHGGAFVHIDFHGPTGHPS